VFHLPVSKRLFLNRFDTWDILLRFVSCYLTTERVAFIDSFQNKNQQKYGRLLSTWPIKETSSKHNELETLRILLGR
jgi:hypothetical protein